MSQITQTADAPTVLLVHGAFADSSSWREVIERLQGAGVKVIAAANPLRGITNDSAYVASLIDQTPGTVIAVGHSYGGAVITNAATQAHNVVGLVYVAGYAPAAGERLSDVGAASSDSVLGTTLIPIHHPSMNGGESLLEFVVDPARFHDAFAGDLPAEDAAVLAVTQRPAAEAAFSEPNGEPAWERLPSWAIVSSSDRAAGADITRSMAKRAGATITEIDGSHAIMISQPQVVTDVILSAVDALTPATAGPGRTDR